MRNCSQFLFRCLACFLGLSCLVATACTDTGELLDLALDPPERKQIDKSLAGVNNFFVDREFGSINEQYQEIRDTLGLRYIRVLLAWTTDVQPSPAAAPSYGFFDEIIEAIPPGVDVLVVLAHTPSWMSNSANWFDQDPRETFVERWVRPTVRRYAGVPGIVGFEVWNEPDRLTIASDAVLGLDSPENYADLLARAAQVIRSESGKLVVMAATQSIQQSFPDALNYNRRLRDLGVEGYTDIWNVHYYGKSFESVVTSNGVAGFLNSLSIPIWVTESGEHGPNEQLPYVETVWPFLKDEVPGIQRFYYYQFGETGPAETNYGLRTTDPSFPVSDLYVWLRDN